MKIDQEPIEIEQLYLSDDEKNLEGEVALWRAFVMRALDDLKLPSSNARYRRWRHQATKWFMSADENFCVICECANLSVEKVLTAAYEIISSRKKL